MRFSKIIFILIGIIIIFFSIRYLITWDIWDAIRKNRVNFVLNYLKHGGNANFARNHRWIVGPSEQNYTLLMVAARQGRPDIVKILLQYGADPNARTSIGNTALFYAAESGNVNSVELLVKNGADINYSYWPGSSIAAFVGEEDILGEAIFYGHVDVINFLIDQGATIKPGHLRLAERMLEYRKSLKSIIPVLRKHVFANAR